jgi:hypothetical protein
MSTYRIMQKMNFVHYQKNVHTEEYSCFLIFCSLSENVHTEEYSCF